MIGWCPPTKIDDDGKTLVKTKSEWNSKVGKSATRNWMALNVIQYGVDSRKFMCDPKGSVLNQGVPKMKRREMIRLSYYASTNESKNYKEVLND